MAKPTATMTSELQEEEVVLIAVEGLLLVVVLEGVVVVAEGAVGSRVVVGGKEWLGPLITSVKVSLDTLESVVLTKLEP